MERIIIMAQEKAYETEPLLIDMPMPIVTPRLILRPSQHGDGQQIAEAVDETWDQLSQWMDWAKDRKEQTDSIKKEAFARIQKAKFDMREDMMIRGIERSSGKIVVFTGFHDPDWRIRRFEVGYWVRSSAQGKGYAAEATNALLRYAFHVLSARVISIGHAEGNEGSQKIIEKLGFASSGIKPFDHELPDGSLINSHRYYRTDTNRLPDLDVNWGCEP